jgi:hypothetical protein
MTSWRYSWYRQQIRTDLTCHRDSRPNSSSQVLGSRPAIPASMYRSSSRKITNISKTDVCAARRSSVVSRGEVCQLPDFIFTYQKAWPLCTALLTVARVAVTYQIPTLQSELRCSVNTKSRSLPSSFVHTPHSNNRAFFDRLSIHPRQTSIA